MHSASRVADACISYLPAGTVPRLRKVLQQYRVRDLDFCVDASMLSILTGFDATKAMDIVAAFTVSPSSNE